MEPGLQLAGGVKRALTATLLLMTSCGVPNGSGPSADGSPRWEGAIRIGTQCPYGMVSKYQPTAFRLEGCPLPIQTLRIVTPPGAILFSGDCREKTLAIRTDDLALDSLWQVFPDDQFNVGAGPLWVQLSEDSDGHKNCWTEARIRVRGGLSCRDQDRMKILLDEISLILSVPGDLASPPPVPDLQRCHLPKSCELQGSARLDQCST